MAQCQSAEALGLRVWDIHGASSPLAKYLTLVALDCVTVDQLCGRGKVRPLFGQEVAETVGGAHANFPSRSRLVTGPRRQAAMP